eukprot:gnl/TRDRNA2_/TRDRNA2_198174_c0_seq1.p1 gnl/TRDRNA2_/TRDRNA2_198174_c0~~gnl/TRDRNA2_/TRDRNA2_198174_c0_seq1.p1  ORF type:complete len:467 (+),score=91.72 gnl/TRDRNA2_/TRDRNA2_198174_c0_seq1:115-1515(+)
MPAEGDNTWSLYHRQMVEDLFDDYAETFEAHLVDKLDYRGPEAVRCLVRDLMKDSGTAQFGTVVDLGCGTGLCGEVLRDMAGRLVGIDISAKMIEVAQSKGYDGQRDSDGQLYDQLLTTDAAVGLGRLAPESVDLIVAGDMFIYVWSVAVVLTACFKALRPGGLLLFTTEHLEEGEDERGWVDREASERFAHAQSFITRACIDCGLQLEMCEEFGLRRENTPTGGLHVAGDFIPGDVYIARRPIDGFVVSDPAAVLVAARGRAALKRELTGVKTVVARQGCGSGCQPMGQDDYDEGISVQSSSGADREAADATPVVHCKATVQQDVVTETQPPETLMPFANEAQEAQSALPDCTDVTTLKDVAVPVAPPVSDETPPPKDQKAALVAVQSLSSAKFSKELGLAGLSGNALSKMKRSEYEAVWRRFCTEEAPRLTDPARAADVLEPVLVPVTAGGCRKPSQKHKVGRK